MRPWSPLGPSGSPCRRSWDVYAPWTSVQTSGTLRGSPWDHRRTPGNPHGPQKQPYLKQIQRHKVSIGASEPFSCNASPQRRPWTVLSCTRQAWRPFGRPQGRTRGDPRFQERWMPMGRRRLPIGPPGQAPLYILYIYTYINVYDYIYGHKTQSEHWLPCTVSKRPKAVTISAPTRVVNGKNTEH